MKYRFIKAIAMLLVLASFSAKGTTTIVWKALNVKIVEVQPTVGTANNINAIRVVVNEGPTGATSPESWVSCEGNFTCAGLGSETCSTFDFTENDETKLNAQAIERIFSIASAAMLNKKIGFIGYT